MALRNDEDTMQKVTLYFFEYCDNNLGIWNRAWALTKEAAEESREETAKRLGVEDDYKPDEVIGGDSGDYGDILPVDSVEVELTPEGILNFANNYAVEPLGA